MGSRFLRSIKRRLGKVWSGSENLKMKERRTDSLVVAEFGFLEFQKFTRAAA